MEVREREEVTSSRWKRGLFIARKQIYPLGEKTEKKARKSGRKQTQAGLATG
jgi:hypothetical protein